MWWRRCRWPLNGGLTTPASLPPALGRRDGKAHGRHLAGSKVPALGTQGALRPDDAVLDGRLPDGSGIEVCRDIRSRHPELAALILTSYDDDETLFPAITAGAAGYVLKQIRGHDLVDAVRRVAAGQSLLDPAVTAQVLDRLRQCPREGHEASGAPGPPCLLPSTCRPADRPTQPVGRFLVGSPRGSFATKGPCRKDIGP